MLGQLREKRRAALIDPLGVACGGDWYVVVKGGSAKLAWLPPRASRSTIDSSGRHAHLQADSWTTPKEGVAPSTETRTIHWPTESAGRIKINSKIPEVLPNCNLASA